MIYGANIYAAQEYSGINGGFSAAGIKKYYTGGIYLAKQLLRRGLGF